MEREWANVYCEVHGCIHEATRDPYDYGYTQSGEEPECGPDDWRKLWIGAPAEEDIETCER